MKFYKFLFFSVVMFYLVGCSGNPIPKVYGYYRIDLPEHSYRQIDSIMPFTFNISTHAVITPDDQGSWWNIDYPQWNARIHFSYMPIDRDILQVAIEESRTLAYEHTVKANSIINNPYSDDTARVYGLLYEITGNAASPIQFFLTDSVNHFLRGALYFDNLPNADSIAPVSTFVYQDMIEMIESLRWK